MKSRWLMELEDSARASTLVRRALCQIKRLTNRQPPLGDHQALARHIAQLCNVARLATSEDQMCAIEAQIHQCVQQLDVQMVNWAELVPGFDNPHISKAVVLKPWVSEREKGVVLVNFENQYLRLLRLSNLTEFAARYTLVVGPSWHPPHSLVNCVFPEAYPDRVFSLISNERELEMLPRLSPKFIPLPLYGSSWVNPLLFKPRPWKQRDVDILMVANWSKTKRHHALFKALRKMPPDLNVLLIGQDQDGRTPHTILSEAQTYGVQDRFKIIANAGYPEVIDAYCRAKISLVLSRREGSCVAVAESMFADTPVAIYEDAAIGSRAFINPTTGRFLKHHALNIQLIEFLQAANQGKYAPRSWADANISCFRSAHTLNDILQQHALSHSQRWTLAIAPVTWCPDQQLALPEDRMRLLPERKSIKNMFGIELG